MLQSLVPVLLLVTVALSSTKVLPNLSVDQLDTEPGFNSQHDNIISNNNRQSNILNNIFYKLPETPQNMPDYMDNDNNISDDFEDTVTANDNYDGKGFRKEQWHNYPRQLDRLSDPDKIPLYNDPGDENKEFEADSEINEFPIRNKNKNDLVSILAQPLLVLKIHLGNLLNGTVDKDFYNYLKARPENIGDMRSDKSLQSLQNSLNNPTLQKRDDAVALLTSNPDTVEQKKTVRKRIFSLWSRLQSLSHKGHELQHRRHIYALYNNLQDASSNGGGGILTAETRAFLRPPGSPLRWG